MRIVRAFFGFLLVGFGFLLLLALLYDASAVTALLGPEPAPSEGTVAAVGLGLVAFALVAGSRILWRARPAPTGTAPY